MLSREMLHFLIICHSHTICIYIHMYHVSFSQVQERWNVAEENVLVTRSVWVIQFKVVAFRKTPDESSVQKEVDQSRVLSPPSVRPSICSTVKTARQLSLRLDFLPPLLLLRGSLWLGDINTDFESDTSRFQKHCFANNLCKRTPFSLNNFTHWRPLNQLPMQLETMQVLPKLSFVWKLFQQCPRGVQFALLIYILGISHLFIFVVHGYTARYSHKYKCLAP